MKLSKYDLIWFSEASGHMSQPVEWYDNWFVKKWRQLGLKFFLFNVNQDQC